MLGTLASNFNNGVFMRNIATAIAFSALAFGQISYANDWEKYYRPAGSWPTAIAYDGAPEMLNSGGNPDADIERMWRQGFALIGYTSFQTGNNSTADAVRFAKKLQARYVIVGTNLDSSQMASIPLTLPNNTTSYTNGTVSAYGNGRSVNGNYSGTNTTYGTQTTFIPMRMNRFTKTAFYFKEVPKYGLGIGIRDLSKEEMQRLGTRRAIAIRYIRDGSPAFNADLFPGDIITKINGQPVDMQNVKSYLSGPQPLLLQVERGGQSKEISVTVPPEWQPK